MTIKMAMIIIITVLIMIMITTAGSTTMLKGAIKILSSLLLLQYIT